MKTPVWVVVSILVLLPHLARAVSIMSDSWADGGRDNGADPFDTGWYTTTSFNAIEVGSGFLGLVSGNQDRGIHGTFAATTLAVGETLTASFTFSTPATVGSSRYAGLKVGLFHTLGRLGLNNDLMATSLTPNFLLNGLPGYTMDFDVNTGGNSNITFRQHDTTATPGVLLSDFNAFPMISTGGSDYTMAPGATYQGVFSLTRYGTDSMLLFGALYQGETLLASYHDSDLSGISPTVDMIAFQSFFSTFGSSNLPNTPDNGIDFLNISVVAVPEPAHLSLLLALTALLPLAAARRAPRTSLPPQS